MTLAISPTWKKFVEKNGRATKLPKINIVEPFIAPEIWDDGEIPWDFRDDNNVTTTAHPGPVFPRRPRNTDAIKTIDL